MFFNNINNSLNINKWFLFILNFNFIFASSLPFLMDFETCQTDVCIKDALHIISSINKSIDPCTDFYEFACGAWMQNNKLPTNEVSWTRWEPVVHKIDQKLKEILQNSNLSSGNTGLKIAQNMFNSCLNIDENESENIRELVNFINSLVNSSILGTALKKWDFSLFSVAKINSKFNVFPLLKFHIALNLYDTSETILYIDYPNLSFPKLMLKNPHIYGPQINSHKSLIKKFLQKIKISLKLPLINIDSQVLKIIDFEVKLAQIMDLNKVENIVDLYKKMTVGELQIWTNLISVKKINWVEILNKLFQNKVIYSKSNIIVKDLVFVLNLIKLIDKTSPETISNYVAWTLLNYFSNEISSNFDEISIENDKLLYGVGTNISRLNKCVISINKRMNPALSYEYVRNNVPHNLKQNVEIMVETIKNVLLQQLSEFDWFDDVTKGYALEKARYISYMVAYPDYFSNISYINNYYKGLFSEENYIKNIILWNNFMRKKEFNQLQHGKHNFNWNNVVTDVNAYYNILQNTIIIPSGIIQHPFYDENRLSALNYGAIGTLIGHELSHAFDNTGRQADKNGNIKQWWTNNSLEKYAKKLKCLDEHYDTYIINIIQNLESITNSSKTILKLNPKTQDENIADIIGVKLAFEAFLVNKQNIKLPGLDFTEEQLFFISFAHDLKFVILQLWCENTTPENLFLQLIDGDHTPNKLRIIGSLSNNPDFVESFNCPEFSDMNPTKKCVL